MTVRSKHSHDPRNAEWDGIKIEQWEASRWRQWKPKATGTDYLANMEREYLRIRYAVEQANIRLNTASVKIRLKLTSPSAIGLQGTFPCKSGDTGKNGSPNKQYTISLGISANDAGVKVAESKAHELNTLLMTKKFEWIPELLGKQANKLASNDNSPNSKIIKDLIKDYEVEYWKTRERDRRSLRNWKDKYINYLKKLPQDTYLSKDALVQALESTKPKSEARFILVIRLKRFCEFCNFDATKLIDSYNTGSAERKKRVVPSDDQVIIGFKKIGASILFTRRGDVTPDEWEWVFGMLATYGIRPHELFAIDLKAFTDPSNTYSLVTLNPEIIGGCKTGERNCGIPPLHPNWVDLFDLKNVKLPLLSKDIYSRTKTIAAKFRREHIGFSPYDLRHAYAIRGHRLRIPIKAMADYMGHTVNEHTETYQKWMDKDANLEIYKEVVIRKQTMTKEEMQFMIVELRAENAAIKAENESLKVSLIKYQLNSTLVNDNRSISD